MRHFLLLAALISSSMINELQAQTTIGFTNETATRNNTFRLGSARNQGLAIRLSHEKLQLLAGHRITAIRTVFGSKNSDNNQAQLFIGETPVNPSYSEVIDISKTNQWIEYPLTSPYLITGEEEALYIGYTLQIGTQYGPLSADFSQDIRGISYALAADGSWQDLYSKGYGCANIEIVVDADLDYTDLMLKTLDITGYNKVGESKNYQLQVYNAGTTTIDQLTVTATIGNQEPISATLSGTNIAPHSTFDVNLPEVSAVTFGQQEVQFSVSTDMTADADYSDNQCSSTAYFYPEDTEKNVLVEFFTGQTCNNCPTGHQSMNNAIANAQIPVIEVSHHAGYSADIFSMNESWDLVRLYGGSTYAPAAMFNRTALSGSETPVFEVSSQSANISHLKEAYQSEPYFSLSLDAPYNADTKTISLTMKAYTHVLPEGKSDLYYTLYLIQDSLIAAQNGAGADYVHNAVCRGCLTEGSWGEATSFSTGEVLTIQREYTLPDTIISTYYRREGGKNHIATDVSQMKIVALIHDHATAIGQNKVYNSIEVPIGQQHTQGGFPQIGSIEEVTSDLKRNVWSREGQTLHVEQPGSLSLYDLQGHLLAHSFGKTIDVSQVIGQGIFLLQIRDTEGVNTYKIRL